MVLDDLTGALCRDPGADPGWWDHDATRRQRVIAVWLCAACPARPACAALADALGPAATGVWAGRYRPWLPELDTHDATMTAFLATFGPGFDRHIPETVDDDQGTLFDMKVVG